MQALHEATPKLVHRDLKGMSVQELCLLSCYRNGSVAHFVLFFQCVVFSVSTPWGQAVVHLIHNGTDVLCMVSAAGVLNDAVGAANSK